jgi:hypothetical protein
VRGPYKDWCIGYSVSPLEIRTPDPRNLRGIKKENKSEGSSSDIRTLGALRVWSRAAGLCLEEEPVKLARQCRGWASSPPAAARAVGPLREDIAEQRVVLVLVHVVNAYVSLQIIRPWILVLSIGTERTYVSRRVVYQTVPDHLVLALEALSSLAARAALDGAVVWPGRRVHVGMRVEQILGLERRRVTPAKVADVDAYLGIGQAVDAHAIGHGRGRGWRGAGLVGARGLDSRAAAILGAGAVMVAVGGVVVGGSGL